MKKEELLRRKPLWEAMGDLFLDTETRWSVPYVARRCAESGYDDEALEHIFWGEVFPEAIPNLLQVAGEWGVLALDEAALVKRANHPSIPWLTRRAHGWMVQDSWLGVRQVSSWLRGLGEEELTSRVNALTLLAHRFFEPPGERCLLATPERVAQLRAVAREEWLRYEPVCRAMLGAEEKSMPADGCAEAVQRMLA